MKGKVFFIACMLVSAAIFPAGFFAYKAYRSSQAPFSASIRKQVTSTILYPDPEKLDYVIKRDTVKYDAESKLLSYVITSESQQLRLIVSEQPSPEMFADIPETYQKFVEKLLPVVTFENKVGKVTITQPNELKGEQSAVLNAQGTLMFVRSKKLPEDQWRRIMAAIISL